MHSAHLTALSKTNCWTNFSTATPEGNVVQISPLSPFSLSVSLYLCLCLPLPFFYFFLKGESLKEVVCMSWRGPHDLIKWKRDFLDKIIKDIIWSTACMPYNYNYTPPPPHHHPTPPHWAIIVFDCNIFAVYCFLCLLYVTKILWLKFCCTNFTFLQFLPEPGFCGFVDKWIRVKWSLI